MCPCSVAVLDAVVDTIHPVGGLEVVARDVCCCVDYEGPVGFPEVGYSLAIVVQDLNAYKHPSRPGTPVLWILMAGMTLVCLCCEC